MVRRLEGLEALEALETKHYFIDKLRRNHHASMHEAKSIRYRTGGGSNGMRVSSMGTRGDRGMASDKADGEAHETYENLADLAADQSSRIVLRMLSAMDAGQ